VFVLPVQVRYAECDMQGHVFNAHYLTWFDMAHTALLKDALSRPYSELVASGIDVVVAGRGSATWPPRGSKTSSRSTSSSIHRRPAR
jgi:hypothetical protein